jgi:hypothetical protein
MAALTVLTPTISGAPIAVASAAGGGDTFVNNGETLFYVANGSGGSITVTFATAGVTNQGIAIADVAVAVGAGETKLIGPFDPSVFNDSQGRVAVTYSGVTSLTVKPISRI